MDKPQGSDIMNHEAEEIKTGNDILLLLPRYRTSKPLWILLKTVEK
jgi:hypothetical protein